MKRKLKTIQKLMEEYPDWEFDEGGYLHLDKYKSIGCFSLIEFGKTSVENWTDNMFEPEPEKKKLYAVVVDFKTDKEFIFHVRSHRYKLEFNEAWYSEFDLEFE